MSITDIANNPIDPSSVSFYGFRVTAAPEFPHDIYSFLIRSVRQTDKDDGNELVLRWLASAQSEFEDTYERILGVQNLLDPELAPEEALPYLKWIVGFTAKLDYVTGGLSSQELRRLIAIGVRMWKFKGTEKGMAETLQAVTARPVRILNWFFFRIIVDEVELGREELDVDAWLLDQPGMSPSILPDAVTRTGPIAEMDVLPSADSPAWVYVDEGHATEGDVFTLSSGELVQTQDDADALGARYVLNYPPDLDPEDARLGAVWTPTAVSDTGTKRPWHLLLCDGIRRYVFAWSATEVALEDTAGNVLVGPLSRGFSVGVSYRMRLYKTATGTLRASVDDLDLFGEVSASLFPSHAVPQFGFGYLNLGEDQDWVCTWDDVGSVPTLDFDLSSLLGTEEAVPHQIRVKYVPKNVVRTIWS